MLVSSVGDSVTRSLLAAVVVDCALWGDDAVMSAPVAPPALRSAGLLLLIGDTLVAGAGPAADVGAAVAAGEAGAADGVGDVVDAEPEVSAGAGLAVDDELEMVGSEAGLLTLVVVPAGVSAVVVAGVDAAAVEVEPVAADVWSAGPDVPALESGAGVCAAVLAGVDVEAGSTGDAVVVGAAGAASGVEAGAGAGAEAGLEGGGLEGGAEDAAAGADGESLTTAGDAPEAGVVVVAAAGALAG